MRLLECVAAENACHEMLVKAAEASRAEGFWKHLGFKRYTGSTDVKSLWAKEGYWAGNDEHGQLLVALSAAVASPADARTKFEAAVARVLPRTLVTAAAGRRHVDAPELSDNVGLWWNIEASRPPPHGALIATEDPDPEVGFVPCLVGWERLRMLGRHAR